VKVEDNWGGISKGRSIGGILEEGWQAPCPPAKGLQQCCKFSQQGPGWGPGCRIVFLYFK